MTMDEKLQNDFAEENIEETADDADDIEETADAEEMSADELAALLIKMGKEKEESEERYLRLQADFDNYRKRTLREKDDLVKMANAELFKLLLPIIDNLERATHVSDDSDAAAVKEGVHKIIKQFCSVMALNDVDIVKTVGEDFDPNIHDAVMREDAGPEMSGKVTAELQKGYTMAGKLLRPAMVKVGE